MGDGCRKTTISGFGHKLMTALEAFWPWDLTGVGWVGLADAFNVDRRFRNRNSARWVCENHDIWAWAQAGVSSWSILVLGPYRCWLGRSGRCFRGAAELVQRENSGLSWNVFINLHGCGTDRLCMDLLQWCENLFEKMVGQSGEQHDVCQERSFCTLLQSLLQALGIRWLRECMM